MNPAVDVAINAILVGVFVVLKAQGLAEEEAKAMMASKIGQIETLQDLPVDPK